MGGREFQSFLKCFTALLNKHGFIALADDFSAKVEVIFQHSVALNVKRYWMFGFVVAIRRLEWSHDPLEAIICPSSDGLRPLGQSTDYGVVSHMEKNTTNHYNYFLLLFLVTVIRTSAAIVFPSCGFSLWNKTWPSEAAAPVPQMPVQMPVVQMPVPQTAPMQPMQPMMGVVPTAPPMGGTRRASLAFGAVQGAVAWTQRDRGVEVCGLDPGLKWRYIRYVDWVARFWHLATFVHRNKAGSAFFLIPTAVLLIPRRRACHFCPNFYVSETFMWTDVNRDVPGLWYVNHLSHV